MNQLRPGSFQVLPVIIKNLIIINVLVFLAQNVFSNSSFSFNQDASPFGYINDTFALHHILSPLFKPWQLVTNMFMHGGIGHLFFNMFALWMFGSVLENLWGAKRFLIFYLICGLGADVLHMVSMYYDSSTMITEFNNLKANLDPDAFVTFVNKHGVPVHYTLDEANNILNELRTNANNIQVQNQALTLLADTTNQAISFPTMGASGAVFGCLAAFGLLFPNHLLYFYFFVPIKAKWFVTGYIVLELFLGFQKMPGDNIARFAHVGGAVMGLILAYFWKKNSHRFRRWY